MAQAELSTFGDIVRQVQLLTGNRCDIARAGEFVNLAVSHLWHDYTWSAAKVDTTLTLIGQKQQGFVSLNLNRRLVDGFNTAFTPSDVGSFLRVSSEVQFFRVIAVRAQQLTLETAYPGNSFSLQTYSLFRHLYTLPADFRRFISPTYWDHLQEVTQQQIDDWDPLRLRVDALPIAYAMRGLDRNGQRLVEIWPVPSIPLLIRYTYLKSLPSYGPLDGATLIPLRSDVLAYRAASEALITLAAEERNERSSQTLMTLAQQRLVQSESILEEAYRADRLAFGVPETVPEARRFFDMGSYYTFLPVQPAPGQILPTGDSRFVAVSWLQIEVPTSPLDARRIRVSWVELEVPADTMSPRRTFVSWIQIVVPEAPARQVFVSWVEIQTPDVVGPRAALISWIEIETPDTSDRSAWVSWVEIEVPDVAAPRLLLVSWVEIEVPTGDTRLIQISWVEIETPDTLDRHLQVSWVEIEVPDGDARQIQVSWVEIETP